MHHDKMRPSLRVAVVGLLFMGLVGIVSGSDYSPDSSCFTGFHFDESSEPASDFCGSNDGFFQGSPTTGVTGYSDSEGTWGDYKAFEYDGSSDYLTTGIPSEIDSGYSSMAAFVKLDDISNGRAISSYRDTSGGGTAYTLYYDAGENAFACMYKDSNFERVYSTTSPNTGEWYSVGCNADASGGDLEIFVNGQVETSTTGGDGIKTPNDHRIGHQESTSNYFDGVIDEYREYNKKLNSTEISNFDQYGNIYGNIGNQAIQFDSVGTDPMSWTVGSNITVNANVSDYDGNVSSVEASVWENGTQIKSDVALTESQSGEWTVSDLFTVDESDVYYNYSLTATDDDGATTEYEDSQFIKDEDPEFKISGLENKTYFQYSKDWTVDVQKDGDNVRDETISCTTYLDKNQSSTFSGLEPYSESGSVSADLGQHSFKVSCTDPAGNTKNKSVQYTVKAFEFTSTNGGGSVFETSTQSYDSGFTQGEMVQDIELDLKWNGSVVNQSSLTGTGIVESRNDSLSYPVPLVSSDGKVFDWNYEASVNYTDFEGNDSVKTYSSGTESQTIEWVVENPQISTVNDRFIEKQDVKASVLYQDNGFNGDVSCEVTVNGSSRVDGCTQSFDTGLASSNKESISVSGKAMLEFKDSSRNTSEPSKSVDVYKKILTDCSNSVDGVTGDKALEFTLYNEENRTQNLNGNIVYNFDVTDHGEHSRNYAFDNSGVKSADTCIYPSWAEYSVTGPVQYSSDSSQNSLSKTFKDRQYNLYNQTLNNNSDSVDLYLLSDDFATPVYFEVTDQAGDPVGGATVTVNRYFIGEDSYLTVAKSEADSDGVATTYMRVNEIYYKYTVTKDGEVLLDTDRQILTCQNSPCTKELRVNPEEDNPYFVNEKGFSYNTSKILNDDGNLTGFQATVSHDSDVMKEASLQVEKGQGVAEKTICDVNATSNPATLVCEFGSPAGDDYIDYTLRASTDGETYLLDKGVLNKPPNVFGDQAYFPAAMIFLMFSMMGLVSPKLSIVFSTAGIIVPWALGLYSLSLAAVGSLVAVGIILVVTNNS